ncbi:MAG: caspase family protein [Deltaproteobacteria bacterium]|nr:caspase family protein [Deltaproteobacteria bacterium]
MSSLSIDLARGRCRPAALAIVLVALVWLGSARAADARFALVIGWNEADDDALEPLRYADDDALRYHELLSAVTERAIVLTTPDPETAALVEGRAAALGSLPPTRANILAALQELRADMANAKARGDRPILYFTYSGHGNYDAEGRGYVHIADGRFTTRDLFGKVLAPTADDPVILLIDACNAALLVNGRGKPAALEERRPAGRSKLDLADYPNVGVILASSQLGETHEWGRYLAGVFSHEVRSGLLGAADLDDDQQIGFAELAAFVASANVRVKNPTVKLNPYIRPPLTDPNIAIVDLDPAASRLRGRVRVDARIHGKAHVVDHDLVRYADFHRTREAPSFWLALTRPGELVLVNDEDEWVIPAEAAGDMSLAQIPRRRRQAASSRGPGSEYFDRTLFHEPYDPVFAHRYLSLDYPRALELHRVVEAPWYENRGAWVVLGSGLAVIAGGFGMQLRAQDLEDEAHRTPWADQRRRLNEDMQVFDVGATVLYGVGGAALVTGLVMFAADQPTRVETWRPPLAVELDATGVRLRSTW